MSNMDNDAYSMFLKQQQLMNQNQVTNNMQPQTENNIGPNAFQLQAKEGTNSSGTQVGESYLEKALDFIAKQNQINMNIHINKNNNK